MITSILIFVLCLYFDTCFTCFLSGGGFHHQSCRKGMVSHNGFRFGLHRIRQLF